MPAQIDELAHVLVGAQPGRREEGRFNW